MISAWRRDGAISMLPRQYSAETDVELSSLSTAIGEREHPMAPDRGSPQLDGAVPDEIHRDEEEEELIEDADGYGDDDGPNASLLQRDEAQRFLAERADQGQNFTLRGVLVGLAIGVIICFSNMYFGLQTGWVSGMAMPAALIGFGFFKSLARCIDYPFTPVENVLVQTVAGALGTMPLGCGFVGVMPALNYLLLPEENGPLVLSTSKLIVWSLGICFFGVVFAVPLRREVIIREKLKFPSGTATALMIGVLHGDTDEDGKKKPDSGLEIFRQRSQDRRRSSSMDGIPAGQGGGSIQAASTNLSGVQTSSEEDHRDDWKAKIKLLLIAFGISAIYVRLIRILKSRLHLLILPDARIVLHPSSSRSSSLWSISGQRLVMDTKPFPSLCRSGYHYGPSHNSPHAPRRCCRLGFTLTTR